MKILIVAATRFELEETINKMEHVLNNTNMLIKCTYKNIEIDFLITGIGMITTTYYLSKVLDDSYDVAINSGICGSFNRNLEIGSVVNIYEDCFSELGAEDGDKFLSLNELNLPGSIKITNSSSSLNYVSKMLPKVNGITVNTTHGNEKSIEKVVTKFHPITESMEGAAFMFVCENEKIPYIQIRAVSNYVEFRNKNAWNIPLALENLNATLINLLNEF